MQRHRDQLHVPLDERYACLTFAPWAWLKLQFFCHAGNTEIGGFGISAEDDPLHVEEFVTVRQQVTPLRAYPDNPRPAITSVSS